MARRSNRKRRQRQPKERLIARLKRRGREARDLGKTLIDQPREFPGQALGLLKRSFRTMWDARGGGFYACGFVLTFIWLEIKTVYTEVSASDGVVDFFTEQFFEFLFRFSLQSLGNTVQAFIWPLPVIDAFGGAGIAGLLAAYLLFSRVLKAPLTDWLFADAVQGAKPLAAGLATTDAADDDKAARG